MLNVITRPGTHEMVELVVEDSGCGITSDEKEKLFLPYFSTKGRGTGLGLAIVSHILAEHDARIRVEDNKPCGGEGLRLRCRWSPWEDAEGGGRWFDGASARR